VQRTVDLDELHRPLVLGEHGERGVAHRAAVRGVCVRCGRRDGRRPVHSGLAEPVDDVARLDARPHHDA
jgi:hypothetical protein